MTEYRFEAEEWKALSPDERIRRCRSLEGEARKLAAEAPPQVRSIYLDIATRWAALANEFEDQIRRNSLER